MKINILMKLTDTIGRYFYVVVWYISRVIYALTSIQNDKYKMINLNQSETISNAGLESQSRIGGGVLMHLSLSVILMMPHLIPAFLGGALVILSLISTPSSLHASVPQLINYQGRLTDVNNNPLSGNFNIVFRICGNSTCSATGDPIWTESHTGGNQVTVSNGVYSVLLGSIVTLPFSAFDGDTTYLEVQVSGETLLPRQRLTSVSYAYNSARLEGYDSSFYVSTSPVAQTIEGTKTFTSFPVKSGGLTPAADGEFATKSYVDNTAGGGIGSGASGQTLRHNGSVWTANNLITNDGTNVGIGTTGPSSILDVVGGSITVRGASAGISINGNSVLTSGSGGTTGLEVSGSTQTKSGGLNVIGKIGVGITNPGLKLESRGNYALPATSGSNSNGSLRLSQTTGDLVLDMGLGSSGTAGAWLQAHLGSNAASKFPIFLNPNGGNVGIGTTAPAEQLHVENNVRAQRLLLDSNNFGSVSDISLSDNAFIETDDSIYFSVDSDNDDTSSFFAFGKDSVGATGFSELVRITNAGHVGIGTTAPARPLDVINRIRLRSSGGSTAGIWYSDGATERQFAGVQAHSATGNNQKWGVYNNSAWRFTVQGNGNVGIGTTNPGQMLTVAGTIETSTGGVKFPDGTTQTSAATGMTFVETVGFSGSQTVTWTDIDLSGVVGANNALVFLRVANVGPTETIRVFLRENGITSGIGAFTPGGMTAADISQGNVVYMMIKTDSNGIFEWKSDGTSSNVSMTVIGYSK